MAENNILERFLNNDVTLICSVQRDCVSTLKKWMSANKFLTFEPEDVVQEGMCRVLECLFKKRVSLSCSLTTFLLGFCKLIILEESRKFRKRKISEGEFIKNYSKECFGLHVSVEELQLKQEQIFISLITQLDQKGRELMTMIFEGVSKDQIMEKLGFKNAQALADKKKNCMKKLDRAKSTINVLWEIRNEIFENYR